MSRTEASTLIAGSVLALMGEAWARWLLLAATLPIYGSIAIQNIRLYDQADEALRAALPFAAPIVRSTIGIAIDQWALLSARMRRRFGSVAGVASPGPANRMTCPEEKPHS